MLLADLVRRPCAPSSLLLLLLLWTTGALGALLQVSIYTQTNISTPMLTSPELDLPFSSVLYISGDNATGIPPQTLRIVSIQDPYFNGSNDTWSPPTITIIEHEPNFFLPTALAQAAGVVWHEIYIGEVESDKVLGLWGTSTYGSGFILDCWIVSSMLAKGRYEIGKSDENVMFKLLLQEMELQDTEGAKDFASRVARASRFYLKFEPQKDYLDMDTLKTLNAARKIRMSGTKEFKGQVIDFEFTQPTNIGGKLATVGQGTLMLNGRPISNAASAMRSSNMFLEADAAVQITDDPASYKNAKALLEAEAAEERKQSAPKAPAVVCERDFVGGGSALARRTCNNGFPPDSDAEVFNAKTPPESASGSSTGKIETQITLVKSVGRFQTIAETSFKIAEATAVGFVAMATTFVVLDYVRGEWRAAALGTIALIVGVGGPFAVAGAVGWFAGGILAILFAFLPILFHKSKPPGFLNNSTSILQFVIWGDRDHTGNEKCTKDQGHPCVVSYGPGLMQLAYKWDYYDAVAFMIWANEGFPMSIPDMAHAFGQAYAFQDQANSSQVAQINCGNKNKTVPAYNVLSVEEGLIPPPKQDDLCEHASMSVNLTMIWLPYVNATAAEVKGRIINAQGQGDCKIIDNADNQVTVPDYGIKLQGLPVAIACGLKPEPYQNVTQLTSSANISTPEFQNLTGSGNVTADTTALDGSLQQMLANGSLSVNITMQGLDGIPHNQSSSINQTEFNSLSDTASNFSLATIPAGANPANDSTDGRAGEAEIPIPAPAPFAPIDPHWSACFQYDPKPMANPFCLPNGTYSQQVNTFGFETQKVRILNQPNGSMVMVNFHGYKASSFLTPSDFYMNMTGNYTAKTDGPDFMTIPPWRAFSSVYTSSPTDQTTWFDVLIPNAAAQPPMACFWTDKQYTGEVICLGLGGGNFTFPVGHKGADVNLGSKIKSVSVLGGAVATLFPNSYGDLASQKTSTGIPDLSTMPLGINGNMLGQMRAVLISPSTYGVVA